MFAKLIMLLLNNSFLTKYRMSYGLILNRISLFSIAGKGEMVCIDRCVAKYLDIHEKIGKKLTAMSIQDEELMKKMSN